MKKRFSLPALAVAVAIAGFLSLTMAPKSFAAAQAAKKGVSFSLSGQFIGRAFWAQNQAEDFNNSAGYPTRNTFQNFTQRLRLNANISYGNAGGGMPLVSVPVQFDMTNDYNPTGLAPNGYGTNGWDTLGYTPAPLGFNHDFATFGLRQAYLRLVTPIGMWMFGRMPVKFGMGVAVNTNADGLGDFLPVKQADLGVFLGVLFGNETTAYADYTLNSNGTTTPSPASAVVYPVPNPYYTHIQMGTIPTLELMTLKPINHTSYSLWLTEAHLNQFGAYPGAVINPATGLAEANIPQASIYNPTANITFGGISVKYSNAGTNLSGEFDYFRGRIIASNEAISNYPNPNPNYVSGEPTTYPQDFGYFLPVAPSGSNQYDSVNSYDLYLTGSQLLNTSIPVTVGAKFGIGAPISAGHYNFTYYSQIQNTRTLFGDVIGSNWQTIIFNSPGVKYIYGGTPWALGTNLSNKWALMVDATEHFSGMNDLQESIIYAQWLKTSLTVPGDSYSTSMFGGHHIGTEFDINFTHHFTKTLAWQAWGGYVWTGSGVDSYNNATSTGGVPSTATHKDITALGTAVIWNF
ncbi:MAG: hypothetical protein EVJ48_03360 [Candidatus Acidulodesulfobacterium acidiphilum]|uniref:Uncharacterized protein n=1 Tax=Candidatus Acidulodesulfobacterium acidiphilum TaxID=2597224 RepID=A0A520XEX1_9DELT|nr:MAG: hypothetical protein EVJ48_03360 [Candidatus Acidulodesulfobacterium acidiphilum]